MEDKFFLVNVNVLPEVISKVIEAKNILKTGKAKNIVEATTSVGISRSVFYKYKDSVFEYTPKETETYSAIVSISLNDVKGLLSRLLDIIAKFDINVLEVGQTITVNNLSNLTLSLESSEQNFATVFDSVKKLEGIISVNIIAIEAREF